MCDYSLMSLPNRLAKEGEDLIVHRFLTGSQGLASPDDLHPSSEPQARRSFWAWLKEAFTGEEACPVPAVCIPPGAKLVLHQIGDDFRRAYRVAAEEEVTFVQLTDSAYAYRDAVAFRNGCRVRLQELKEGQRVTVVNLGAQDAPARNTAEDAEFIRSRF